MVNPPLQNDYGTVTGRFLLAQADSSDFGSDLDWIAAGGSVLFTPSPNYIVNSDLDLTFLPATVEAVLNSDGYILGFDGQPGVRLLATDISTNNPVDWTWQIDFRLTDELGIPTRSIPSYGFSLPAGETVDLTSTMPLESSNGVLYLKGDKGDIGNTGPQGPQGERGLQGPPGSSTGDSAYTVASQNGFTGTEAEWLASLVGDQGPQGAQGPQGQTGPTGPQGPQGIKGDKGNTGSVGQIEKVDAFPSNVASATIEPYVEIAGIGYSNYLQIGIPQGPQGDKGDAGDAGPQGPQGTTVVDFSINEQGILSHGRYDPATEQTSNIRTQVGYVLGPKGDKGDKGDTGNRGLTGNNGLSAYEIAVANNQHWYRAYNSETGTETDDNGNKFNYAYAQNEQEYAQLVARGTNGKDGIGLPPGGTFDQVLAKNTPSDYDYKWTTVVTTGTIGSAVDDALQAEIDNGNISAPGVNDSPFMMAAGVRDLSGASAVTRSATSVDFGKNFGYPPIVTATCVGNNNIVVTVSSITTSSMTITVRDVNGTAISSASPVKVHWIAIQMLDTGSSG